MFFRDLPSLYKLIESYCKGIQSPTKSSKVTWEKNGIWEAKNEKVIIDDRINDSNDESPQKFGIPQKKKLSPVKKTFKMNQFIIQKYIEKPLLIHKRKFDIRVWVLVSHTGKCYFFKEGYLRTSGSDFKLDDSNPDDQWVHLTNNAVQKNMKNYGEFEEGNQLSFAQLQQYIDENYGHKNINFFSDCLPKMKDMIKHSLLAARKKLNPNNYKLSFELFGYDFIMDEDFNLWLIEVNTNPWLEESSTLLKHYLRRMVEDMIKIIVDPEFPKPKRSKKTNKHRRRFG